MLGPTLELPFRFVREMCKSSRKRRSLVPSVCQIGVKTDRDADVRYTL